MAVRFLPLATTQSTSVRASSVVRKVSTRTQSRSPAMRVAELSTHINFSFPGGTPPASPGRLVTRTFQVSLDAVDDIARGKLNHALAGDNDIDTYTSGHACPGTRVV